MRCAQLRDHIGYELAPSDWFTIDQPTIAQFAAVTRDHQWIHVDVERAGREAGGTIAHGFLVLSLLSAMSAGQLRFEDAQSVFNYGFNRIRLTAPVRSGARVRLRQTLSNLEEKPSGLLLTSHCEIEIEGQPRPALVADWLVLITCASTQANGMSTKTGADS